VDISFSFVCLCVCLFCVCVFVVRLQISPSMIKLAASHFARLFIGIQGRESQIFANFAPHKPTIGRIGQRVGHAHPHVNVTVEMIEINVLDFGGHQPYLRNG